jgi:CRISPR-associated endonuclease/helicase Cas3
LGEGISRYYAHSSPRTGRGGWEPLAEHLSLVAARAADHAATFGRSVEARVAGLLHDLGKYGDLFAERLRGNASGLDHWSMGALAALVRYRLAGAAVVLAVQGHHVGLQSGAESELGRLHPKKLVEHHPLGLALTDADLDRLLARLAADGLDLPPELPATFDNSAPPSSCELDVRMLFSALVDADYLETEAHFRRDDEGRRIYREAGIALQPARAAALVERAVDDLSRAAVAEGRGDPQVLRLRDDLFAACLAAAERSTGTFTLSAPTGAGKTLAMLAFALRHAERWNLRRIVLAVPYLSILEQTVDIYRKLFDATFGPDYVLEHHSLAGTRETGSGGATDPDEAERRSQRARELAENWDAPIVLTTSVQLLESLHANRPRSCRKLHRLAGSVILLDEVQTLPPELAVPTLATLSHLAHRYGSSVVFATATQPAFETLDSRVAKIALSGWQPREIVPATLDLFARLDRVEVQWRVDRTTPWRELAAEVAALPRGLVVVNLKRHAVALFELVKRLAGDDGVFHLSTNMCPLHRRRVLEEVRARLDDPAHPPCRLISTQCIEAGVDVDFPVLYRALAPLDSIAQAAGRCNRHGRLPGKGLVVVFVPDDEERRAYPPGGYRQGAGVTRQLLAELGPTGMDLRSPALFRRYYTTLYGLKGIDTGEHMPSREIEGAIERLDFPEIDRLYRLIEKDAVDVLVPYEPEQAAKLVDRLSGQRYVPAAWLREARPQMVSVYRPNPRDPLWSYLEPLIPDADLAGSTFQLIDSSLYDRNQLGLRGAPDIWIA